MFPKGFQYYWAGAAAYELAHKVSALKDTRIRKPNWYEYKSSELTKLERSRPMVASERVIATLTGTCWAPLVAPMHLLSDIVRFELRTRGIQREDVMFLDSWDQAIFV